MNCELVVAGNLSLDDVSLPDGSRQKNVIGGDALYGALGARLWCPGVGMLSRRAGDFSPESLQRCREAVSYTHLDVYKRQHLWCTSCHASGTAGQLSADRINAESI